MSEDEIDERRGEEDETWQSVEEVRHCVEVAKTLRCAQSAGEKRIFGAQDLDHPMRPADALPDVAA